MRRRETVINAQIGYDSSKNLSRGFLIYPQKAPSFCSSSFLFYFSGNSRIVMMLSLLTAKKVG